MSVENFDGCELFEESKYVSLSFDTSDDRFSRLRNDMNKYLEKHKNWKIDVKQVLFLEKKYKITGARVINVYEEIIEENA
jgi:5S rRNA maturation endonuclease (ribonuclease M5)